MMVPLAFLVVLAASLLPLALLALPRVIQAGARGIRPSPWMVVAAVMPLALLFLLSLSGPGGEMFAMLTGLGLLGLFAWLWVREFTGLMSLPDDAFPGRRDKLVWIALMIFLPPVGLISFATFRRAYWPVPKPAADPAAHELA